MEVPNDMHVIIATPGNGRGKRKRVHVNLFTKFSIPDAQVHRLVVSAADDPYLDEPKVPLAGDALKTDQQEELNKLLDKWKDVLRDIPDTPGYTNILLRNVDTGQAPPIRIISYLRCGSSQ